MATQERIEQLKGFVTQWMEWRATAEKQRDSLLYLIDAIKGPRNEAMVEVLQEQADSQDDAARQYDECTTYMQSLLARAENGEDV